MLRFTLREAARLALGLFGAIVMTAMIAALSVSAAWHGAWPFVLATIARLADYAYLDFGMSSVSGLPVADEIARTLPATLALATAGIVIALLLGVPIGLAFGAGPARRAAAPLIQIVAAAPVFCASLALAYLAARYHWPLTMANGQGASVPDFAASPDIASRALKVAVLPALTVGLAGAASVQLALRRAASLTSREPYRNGLRRMGLSVLEIDRVFVVPQVIAGVAASLGELTLALFSAAAVAEWVFAVPGAAVLFVKSVALGDWTLAAPILSLFAAITMFAEFLGRVTAHALANPGVPR